MTKKNGNNPALHGPAHSRDRRELVLFLLALAVLTWLAGPGRGWQGTLWRPSRTGDTPLAALSKRCRADCQQCLPAELYFLSLPMPMDRATRTDLELLPGIGPSLAARIIQARDREGVSGPEDLEQIRGISRNRARSLAPYLRFTSSP